MLGHGPLCLAMMGEALGVKCQQTGSLAVCPDKSPAQFSDSCMHAALFSL